MEIKVVFSTKEIECDILIVNQFEGELTSEEVVNHYAIEKDGFKGKFGETYLLQTYGKLPASKIMAIGFGKKEEFNNNKLREAVAKAVKKAMQMKAKTIAFSLDNLGYDYSEHFTFGALIADYAFDKYKSEKVDKVETVYVQANEDVVNRTVKIAEAMSFARDLINEPAQIVTPQYLADMAESLDVDCRVYNRDEIDKLGMGAFLAVGRGSIHSPKFIHMRYTCDNPVKKIAIVGKGITFDSGGLDLKPAASMLTMKDDMSGAACVLAVIKAVTALNPNVEVHGLIAACENMINGCAYKPGDILRAKNGKTIEIDNTDAEGRLTLADALCYASELGVDEIIDIATLTGACMVALGTQAAGIMGNNDEFVKKLIAVANDAGERFWELPMWDDYGSSLKSSIADMKNTGSRYGGASTAGVFLKKFVSNPRWAHIDIAGVAYMEKAQKEFIEGGTGAGVRTLVKYIAG